MAGRWMVPEGLRVLADGSWWVGDLPVLHRAGLRELKSHLVFEDDGAFVVAGGKRAPVKVDGPAFLVKNLRLDARRGKASVLLDDGSREPVSDGALQMDEATGRFECLVRGGRARAALSRSAHQVLLAHAEETDGRFYLAVGATRFLIRT